MKNIVIVLLIAMVLPGCKKTEGPGPETVSDLLSKKAWMLTDLDWKVHTPATTKVQLSYAALPDLVKNEPFKFSAWIVAADYYYAKEVPSDSLHILQSGEFNLSSDGSILQCSLFTGGLEKKVTYHVDVLTHGELSISAIGFKFADGDSSTNDIIMKFTH